MSHAEAVSRTGGNLQFNLSGKWTFTQCLHSCFELSETLSLTRNKKNGVGACEEALPVEWALACSKKMKMFLFTFAGHFFLSNLFSFRKEILHFSQGKVLKALMEALEGALGFLTPLLLCGSCHGPLPHVKRACKTLVLLGGGQATQKCQELKQTHLAGSPLSACPSRQSHEP